MTQDVRNYIRHYMRGENMWTWEETEGVEWKEKMEKWGKGNRWKTVRENIKKVKGRRHRINHYSLGNIREARVNEGR